jgi:CRP/FNR family transcriptional regulator, cyclic AMP receptor protein
MPGVADVDLEWLRKVTVFSVLAPEQLGKLAAAAEITEHDEGDQLTEEGVLGHRFHLILEGGAVVERSGTEVAAIGPGEFVGEIGLLGGGPSTASVRCTGPTRCLTLRREAFWIVLEEEPSIALRILEVVCRRLEQELRPGPRANLSESGT